MIAEGIVIRSVAPSEISVSEHELAARTGCFCSSAYCGISDSLSEISAVCAPKYCYTVLDVEYPRPGVVKIGECEIVSASLIKNFSGAKKAVVMCATLGAQTDALLRRLSVRTAAGHFMADGAASAMAEALCEYAEAEIKKDIPSGVLLKRFSPGYGDLSLDVQPYILKKLCALSALGVTLTDDFLMVPTKTITAIIGIKNEEKDNNS